MIEEEMMMNKTRIKIKQIKEEFPELACYRIKEPFLLKWIEFLQTKISDK